MKLPRHENCPECNDRMPDRPNRDNQREEYNRSNRDNRQEGYNRPRPKASVFGRLGPRERGRPEEANRSEEGRPMQEDEMSEEGSEEHDQAETSRSGAKQEQLPQWCPTGIFSKSQKRRAQRMRHKEMRLSQEDEHRPKRVRQEWRPKAVEESPEKSASINTVLVLSADFCADEADACEEEAFEFSDERTSAQLVLPPQPAIFDKPEGVSHRHMKPLYIRGHVNNRPMAKMLVDGGAAVNIMPYSTYRKLGRTPEDLIKTNMKLKDFNGNPSEAKGILNAELTVGSKTLPVSFFVTEGKGSYTVLLGRDWIHANCCVPSTMHQCLIQWDGGRAEIVPADRSEQVATADLPVWEMDGIECLSGAAWTADELRVTDFGFEPISTASTLFL